MKSVNCSKPGYTSIVLKNLKHALKISPHKSVYYVIDYLKYFLEAMVHMTYLSVSKIIMMNSLEVTSCYYHLKNRHIFFTYGSNIIGNKLKYVYFNHFFSFPLPLFMHMFEINKTQA